MDHADQLDFLNSFFNSGFNTPHRNAATFPTSPSALCTPPCSLLLPRPQSGPPTPDPPLTRPSAHSSLPKAPLHSHYLATLLTECSSTTSAPDPLDTQFDSILSPSQPLQEFPELNLPLELETPPVAASPGLKPSVLPSICPLTQTTLVTEDESDHWPSVTFETDLGAFSGGGQVATPAVQKGQNVIPLVKKRGNSKQFWKKRFAEESSDDEGKVSSGKRKQGCAEFHGGKRKKVGSRKAAGFCNGCLEIFRRFQTVQPPDGDQVCDQCGKIISTQSSPPSSSESGFSLAAGTEIVVDGEKIVSVSSRVCWSCSSSSSPGSWFQHRRQQDRHLCSLCFRLHTQQPSIPGQQIPATY